MMHRRNFFPHLLPSDMECFKYEGSMIVIGSLVEPSVTNNFGKGCKTSTYPENDALAHDLAHHQPFSY